LILPHINNRKEAMGGKAPASETPQAVIARLQRRIEELERENSRLMTDPVTGLLNYGGIHRKANRMLESVLQQRPPRRILCIGIVDLNRLKRINDELGHEAGNTYLQTAGRALTLLSGRSETVGRIGGDEFLIATYSPRRILEERLTSANGSSLSFCFGCANFRWSIIPDASGLLAVGVQPAVVERVVTFLDSYQAKAADRRVADFRKRNVVDIIDMLKALADSRMYQQKQRHPDRRIA
jgi:GGDEF domain-containing protein